MLISFQTAHWQFTDFYRVDSQHEFIVMQLRLIYLQIFPIASNNTAVKAIRSIYLNKAMLKSGQYVIAINAANSTSMNGIVAL